MKNWWRKILPGGERLKMPARRVTTGFLVLYGLPTLFATASAASGVYERGIINGLSAAGAFLDAATAAGALLFAQALIGVILFYYLTLLTSIVIPDAVAAYGAARRGIAALPSAWQNFVAGTTAAFRRGRQLAGNFFRWVAGVPARILAMTAEDWVMALFAAGIVAIFGGVLYVGWGWASAINAWLPDWMSHEDSWHDWPHVLFIDFLISMIPIALLTTVWGELLRPLVRYARRRNS